MTNETEEIPLLPDELAAVWLREYLGARPHGSWKKNLIADAKEAGHTEAMLQRAAKSLGVRRRGQGRTGVIWTLPPGH